VLGLQAGTTTPGCMPFIQGTGASSDFAILRGPGMNKSLVDT
jgi:hypothetical protein